MSLRLTKDDENCSQDSRDGCPTMGGGFITSRTGVSPVRGVFSGEKFKLRYNGFGGLDDRA